ncbi:MAG: hypothetical protein IKZ46_02820 [Victivallales bacterium]|nr:hypothetical protein [Victivallales bacterium]
MKHAFADFTPILNTPISGVKHAFTDFTPNYAIALQIVKVPSNENHSLQRHLQNPRNGAFHFVMCHMAFLHGAF